MSTGREAAAEIKAYLSRKDPKLVAVIRGLRAVVRGAAASKGPLHG